MFTCVYSHLPVFTFSKLSPTLRKHANSANKKSQQRIISLLALNSFANQQLARYQLFAKLNIYSGLNCLVNPFRIDVKVSQCTGYVMDISTEQATNHFPLFTSRG